MKMYPLLLTPPIKDYLWGGTKLKTDFGFNTEKEIAAEAWMLSCHKDGMNIVQNGEHRGKTINEVLEIWGKSALGYNAESFSYFPILIKLIDAKQKLSVQVHPDDDYALSVEGEYGKTEMWYVVDCEEGAELIYGFKENISKEEFERRIKDNTLTEVCNFVPVNKGDVFFINAGTLHAIGEGILIAEVQQNSNTTYRVSDYGRLGADGKPRELHIDKALEVTKCEVPQIPYGKVGNIKSEENFAIRDLAACDKFSAKLLSLNGEYNVYSKDSFVSLVVLDGKFNLSFKNESLFAKKGDSIFIPASLEVKLDGKADILYSFV
ncbi:MAG: class I mannose-6-phosphate isomerase [Clostridia bacterium]|nr:class I mannose-6-phosphate isomerase [Clostridia bacterium]